MYQYFSILKLDWTQILGQSLAHPSPQAQLNDLTLEINGLKVTKQIFTQCGTAQHGRKGIGSRTDRL